MQMGEGEMAMQLQRIRCFLLDMDGTVYLGNKLLQEAKDAMDLLILQIEKIRAVLYKDYKVP